MKRSELTEIKSLSTPELVKKVTTLRGEMVDLTLDKNMGKLKDNKAVFKKRKDLAKILTVLRQKEMIEQLSVLSSQLSNNGQPVVSKPVEKTEKQKTGGKR